MRLPAVVLLGLATSVTAHAQTGVPRDKIPAGQEDPDGSVQESAALGLVARSDPKAYDAPLRRARDAITAEGFGEDGRRRQSRLARQEKP